MKNRLTLTAVLVAVGAIAMVTGRPQSGVSAQGAGGRWYKGNTHTHTLNSDGDSTPDDVVRWYREHGYQFLVLTDHNYLTSVDGLNALHGADDKFLIVRGEEVSDTFERKPLHLNGLNMSTRVEPQHGSGVPSILQRNVDAIRNAGGVPHVNHPNFEWAITSDDLKAVERLKLFEIYNGHSTVNNQGGGGVPGMEEVWDRLLSSGKVIYGVADDDAHVFKQPGNPNVPGPGRGWVYVRSEQLAPKAIVDALERGEFYASTGVELSDYQVNDGAITIAVKEQPSIKYRIQFTGKDGRLLKEVPAGRATFVVPGGEPYVRAKVLESNGRAAWTQPVFARSSTR